MAEQRLTLREIPLADRHPKIFEGFEALDSGEAPVIVNDYDPNPLYQQMTAETESFDPQGHTVDYVGSNEVIATLVKR